MIPDIKNCLVLEPSDSNCNLSELAESIINGGSKIGSDYSVKKTKISGRTAKCRCNVGKDRFNVLVGKSSRSNRYIVIVLPKFSIIKFIANNFNREEVPPSFKILASSLENFIVKDFQPKVVRWVTMEEANASIESVKKL